MTLLEALVALVILATSAAGFLGVFQAGARSVQSAEAWNRASAAAEASLEESVRALTEEPAGARQAEGRELDARVTVQPWGARIDDVVVQVTTPDGRTLTVHRLVRRR